jgi:hypothetical protein
MADFENIVKNHAAEDGNIPASAIPALVTAIKTAVGNEFVDKERYKAKLTEIDQLKEQQQTAEDNATTAGKWKDKYTDLDKEFKAYKAQIAEEKTLESKKTALREIAKDAGLSESGIAKALKYQDYSKLELDEKGAAKEKAAILKGLKEEWGDYITTTERNGAPTATPPANNGGGKTYKSKDEIMAIKDTAERQKMIAENHELFGF